MFDKNLIANRAEIARRFVTSRKTRDVLALSLSASLCAPIEPTRFGLFRM